MLSEDTIQRIEATDDEPSKLQINYEQTFQNLKVGEVVKGRILRLTENVVVVDIAFKSEGAISLHEFSNPQELKVGAEIDVYIDSLEDDNGICVLSHRKAEKSRGWDEVVAKCNENDLISAKIIRKVKGGLMADIGGVEAFMPASLAFLKGFGNLNSLVDQSLDVKIITINPQRRNIIVSRKDVLERERQQSKEKVFEELEVGVVRSGPPVLLGIFG